jgi:molecular chaperone DnaK (HSP70)
MRYVLGIDLGAGHTTAAVSRLGEPAAGWSDAEAVPLGVGTSAVASVLHVLPDGSVRPWQPEPADQESADQKRADQEWAGREWADKGWVVRGFGRRVGDDVPLIVGGEPYPGQALLAALAMWVVNQVDEREGGGADQIVVSHPGGWGPHRIDLLHRALWRAGLDSVTLLPAPVAAAEAYAAESPVGSGAILAVQDLDGGESAVVRRTEVGTFELLGCVSGAVDADVDGFPGGIEPLLDDALLGHVGDRLRLGRDEPDPSDPAARERIGRLRQACAAARESLVTAVETTIAVDVGPGPVSVTLTRAEFEESVRPLLAAAADTLRGAVRSCGLAPRELAAVVLCGGAARIPLVARLVAAALPVSSAVGGQPELRIARGAALAGQKIADGTVSVPATRVGTDLGRYDGYGRYDGDREYDGDRRYDGNREYDGDPGDYVGAGAIEPFGGGQVPDYADGELAEPPPRPPVHVTPLDLPKRRGRRPSPRPRRS